MNNYHFKSSTGEIIKSKNLEQLKKLAHLEPTNYVRIYDQNGYMINAWGAKKYQKYLIRRLVLQANKLNK
jgi:membrane carboxypeptidase/penicillin-binding protein